MKMTDDEIRERAARLTAAGGRIELHATEAVIFARGIEQRAYAQGALDMRERCAKACEKVGGRECLTSAAVCRALTAAKPE